jgi:hypothetical protein
MFSSACVRLRKEGFRGRQVTGCICFLRHDLVEIIERGRAESS